MNVDKVYHYSRNRMIKKNCNGADINPTNQNCIDDHCNNNEGIRTDRVLNPVPKYQLCAHPVEYAAELRTYPSFIKLCETGRLFWTLRLGLKIYSIGYFVHRSMIVLFRHFYQIWFRFIFYWKITLKSIAYIAHTQCYVTSSVDTFLRKVDIECVYGILRVVKLHDIKCVIKVVMVEKNWPWLFLYRCKTLSQIITEIPCFDSFMLLV